MSTAQKLNVFVHHKDLEIIDSSKSTAIYKGRIQRSKPQVFISRVSDQALAAQTVGEASFHKFSSDIDVQINGQPLSMSRKTVFSSEHELNGAGLDWSWSRDGLMTSDLKLVNKNSGRTLAIIRRETWSRKKLGTIEILEAQPAQILDAIVVTGLAKWELQRRKQRSGAAAAGASAGGSAGGGGC